MTTSLHDRQFEVEGVRFETILPQQMIRIPKQGEETLVKFGVRVINGTKASQLFLFFFARPMFSFDGQAVSRSGPNVNGSFNPDLDDFKSLMSGEEATLMMQGWFYWSKSHLKFRCYERSGSYWFFGAFKAGNYSLQMLYENQFSEWRAANDRNEPFDLRPVYSRESGHQQSNSFSMPEVWVGQGISPPLEFVLIES